MPRVLSALTWLLTLIAVLVASYLLGWCVHLVRSQTLSYVLSGIGLVITVWVCAGFAMMRPPGARRKWL